MTHFIEKGEIFWGSRNQPGNIHLLHPIIIMEDVDLRKPLPEKIKAVILSTKQPKDTNIKNVRMCRYHFEQRNKKKLYYKIRVNRKREEYLVCFGFLKCPTSLHKHESGKLTPLGIQFVEQELSKHGIHNYEYVPYTVKEYNAILKKLSKKN